MRNRSTLTRALEWDIWTLEARVWLDSGRTVHVDSDLPVRNRIEAIVTVSPCHLDSIRLATYGVLVLRQIRTRWAESRRVIVGAGARWRYDWSQIYTYVYIARSQKAVNL